MLEDILDQEIKKVCPIDGISFGDVNDRSTWKIHPTAQATPEQITAAQAALDSFTYTPELQATYDKTYRDRAAKSDLGIMANFNTALIANPSLTLTQYLDSLEVLTTNMSPTTLS